MNIKGKNEAYSLIKVHRENGRLNEELEISINSFSLEELIAIKLELAAQNFNSKMFGIPIWYSLKNVVQDALLKFALSSTKTKREGARLLGILPADFRNLLKKYETESFFEKK